MSSIIHYLNVQTQYTTLHFDLILHDYVTKCKFTCRKSMLHFLTNPIYFVFSNKISYKSLFQFNKNKYQIKSGDKKIYFTIQKQIKKFVD